MGRSLVKCALARGDLVTDVGRTFESTPEEMAAAGADYVVVGRPITRAADPGAAAAAIARALAAAA